MTATPTTALAGRRILITGATGVLGRALALQLSQTDAELVLLSRRRERLEALDDEIAAAGGKSPVLVELDFQRAEDAHYQNLAQQLAIEGVDDLVLCSGAHTGLHPLEHLPTKHWRNIMDVNVNGPFQLIRALLPLLKDVQGQIVDVADGDATSAKAFLGAYGVSKLALQAMLQICSDENAQSLTVTSCVAAPMPSPIRAAVYPGETRDSLPPVAGNVQKIVDILTSHAAQCAGGTPTRVTH